MFIEVNGNIFNTNFIVYVSTVDEDGFYDIKYISGDSDNFSSIPNNDCCFVPRGQLMSALLAIGRNNN